MAQQANELEANYQKGVSYLQDGQVDQAQEVFADLLTSLPKHPVILERLGYCSVLKKKWQQAENYLIKANEQAPNNIDILNNLGCVLQKTSKWEKAHDCFSKIYKLDNTNYNAMRNLAVTLINLNRHNEAASFLTLITKTMPKDLHCRYQLAELYFQQSQYKEAEQHYNFLTQNDPDDLRSILKLALIKFSLDDVKIAKELFLTATENNNQVEASLITWAQEQQNLKAYTKASLAYGLLTEVLPDKIDHWTGYVTNLFLSDTPKRLIKVLEEANQRFPQLILFPRTLMLFHIKECNIKDAYHAAQKVLNCSSTDPYCHMHYASGIGYCKTILGETETVSEAIKYYCSAISLANNDRKILEDIGQLILESKNSKIIHGVINNLDSTYNDYAFIHLLNGAIANQNLRFIDAKNAFEKAVQISPDSNIALRELSECLIRFNEYDRALTIGKKLIDLNPSCPGAILKFSNISNECGLIDESFEIAKKAYYQHPNDTTIQLNLGMQYLLRGNWDQGWPLYQARYENYEKRPFDIPPVPKWDGKANKDIELIIKCEQGFGDAIQFARFVPLAAERVKNVIFVVEPRLSHLFQCLNFRNIQVYQYGYDFNVNAKNARWTSVMDLMWLLQVSEKDLAKNMHYLKLKQTDTSDWQEYLKDGHLNIGIAWQGNPYQKLDIGRSIPLKAFEPIAKLENVNLISLQKHNGLDQLDRISFKEQLTIPNEDFDNGQDAFKDTISLIKDLDLVITSDSALAHLAGSLNKNVWVALKFLPEWRWQLNRNDSSWYPSMRLFRQQEVGKWDHVIEAMEGELKQEIKLKNLADEGSQS